MTAAARPEPTSRRAITVTRVYDAPRELVFRMWIEPEHLAQWWGPHTFTNPEVTLDPRPGGRIHVVMRAPDGSTHAMGGVFREIVPPERIVFTSFVDGPDGRLLESENTVTFEDEGGRTRLTVRASAVGFVDIAARMLAGMEAGWSQSLDKLAGVAERASGHPDAEDRAAIRAIFGDRTNALFGKVPELALKHIADDVVSFDLAPPLQHLGRDRAALQAWFDTWDGPISWTLHDLVIAVGGDIAFARALGHMTGDKIGGQKIDLWVRSTTGFARRGGAWMITHQHTSVPFLMDGSYRAAVDLEPWPAS